MGYPPDMDVASPPTPQASSDWSVGSLIANRYRIEKELGQGGMAVAYAVRDTLNGRTIALKRLRPSEDKADRPAQLFEQEFYTLQQLNHPRVIAAYDFGYVDGAPFYTMEWLGGGDLRDLAPLPPRRVCAVLSDVCSALSLLHSRNLVHRDVTPRNVRCTEDGLAKLIDFGAILPFGRRPPMLVGTPAFCAPEAVYAQELDGRADLFSLGATAYFALTGRHAFPARSFGALRAVWENPPRPPSHYASDIPAALDALVMSLVSLDRAARPGTAAEVMERLSVIGGLRNTEHLVIRQAYLTTPVLVGRDDEVARFRELLERANQGRGSAVAIVGASGFGRSRFLSSCALEAQLQGAVLIRSESPDAASPYATARRLLAQLLDAFPNLAQQLSPEQQTALSRNTSGISPTQADPDADARFQEAFLELIRRAAGERCVVLAVDDGQEVDERSASLLALLSVEARQTHLVVLLTVRSDERDESNAALRFFVNAASVVKMRRLSLEDSTALLRSVFGNVEHLGQLAAHLHTVAAGAPGGLMQLAQHLVDRNIVRYESGWWTIPAKLDATDLPSSLQTALAAKVERLSAEGLALARALALMHRDGLSLSEVRALLDGSEMRQVMSAVSELLVLGMAAESGATYRLSNDAYRPLLRATLSKQNLRELHGVLADILERRPGRGWKAEQHLRLAGREQEALDRMLPASRDLRPMTPKQVAQLACELPAGWPTHLKGLIEYCERAGRPAEEAHHVRMALVGIGALTAQAEESDIRILLKQLEHDSGYDIYMSLADLSPDERLMTTLARAQRRFDETPPHERVAPPATALRLLGRTVISAIGVMGPRFDYAFFRDLHSVEPFVPLSPALQVIQWNVEGTRALATGHYQTLLDRNAIILERMGQPDRAGLDEISHRYMGLALRYSTCTVCGLFGRAMPEEYLAELESDPIFSINACRLRTLAALCVGDTERADSFRRKGDLIQLKENPPQMFAGSYVHREAIFYGFAGDLARLGQLLPDIDARADEMPGWVPIRHHVRGLYHQLRGAWPEALQQFEAGLALVRAGEHPTFTLLAAGLVATLGQLGHHAEARDRGMEALAAARAVELGPQMHALLEALAVTHGALGEHEQGVKLAEEAIQLLEEFDAGGLVLGGAYEARARVALSAGANGTFEVYARRCAQIYRAGKNPLLAARCAALMAKADANRALAPAERANAAAESDTDEEVASFALSDCQDAASRASASLRALVKAAGSSGGLLYVIRSDGARLAAQDGAFAAPEDLDRRVVELLHNTVVDDVTQTCGAFTTEANPTSGWHAADGEEFVPVLLSHPTRRGVEVTAVAALRNPSRSSLPPALLSRISRALYDAGDVSTLLAAL